MNRRELLMGAGAASLVLVAEITEVTNHPKPMRMYDVSGMTIFPAINLQGSYIALVAAFPLIEESSDSLLIYGYRASLQHYLDIRDEYKTRIHHDAQAMFAQALASNPTIIERNDGELLPDAGEIVRFRRRS